MKKEKKKYH